MRTCTVEGCSNKYKAKGYCAKHYWQIREKGTILEVSKFDKNKVAIKHNHAEIELRDKEYNIVGHAIIDKGDVKRCSKAKWCLTTNGYVIGRVRGKLRYLHRYILKSGTPHIDHKNGNKLDNRKRNLRGCTAKQNSHNSKRSKNNTSGHTGVYYDKWEDKWYGQIPTPDGILTSNKWKSKKKVITWRQAMEDKYFGEFTPQRR